MKAIVVGAVESTRIALRSLAAAPDWDVAAVMTLPPELAGRHSDFVDMSKDAAAARAQVIHAANSNTDEILAVIRDMAPDYLFVIGWSQLCGPAFLACASQGAIGFHPAPLPRLRGRGVIPWTILLGEPISASTLFMIDVGTDTGPILDQRYFHVAPDATSAGLYASHMAMLTTMMPDLLARLRRGDTRGTPQDERHATWAARRRPEDGLIDWNGTADAAWRKVRACGDPYPGAWTTLSGQRIVIAAARPKRLDAHAAAMPGQIVARTDESFTVKCGDGGGLHVTEWRREKAGPPPQHALLGHRGTTG
jgi:methionyl-tRNA formyltransferase